MAVTISVVARSVRRCRGAVARTVCVANAFNPQVGVTIISAVAPYAVREPDQIPRLYDWQLPVWLVIAVAGWYVCADRPPSAPSASAAHQWAARATAQAAPLPAGSSRNWVALEAAWSDTTTLMQHANFLYLTLSFSLLTGIGWTFLTIVGQLLEPCGYSNMTAGIANAVFMGANAVGCFAAAPVVENTRAYVAMQRIFSWATAGATLAVLALAVPAQETSVLVAWAALGFAMGPLTPISFEHAAEMTYPLAANSSTSILNILSNLVGFVQTVIITPLLADPTSSACATPATPAAGFTFVNALLGLLFASLVVKEYKRQTAEGVVAGDPWEACGVEEGYAARIPVSALPGPAQEPDERAALLPPPPAPPMTAGADDSKQA